MPGILYTTNGSFIIEVFKNKCQVRSKREKRYGRPQEKENTLGWKGEKCDNKSVSVKAWGGKDGPPSLQEGLEVS